MIGKRNQHTKILGTHFMCTWISVCYLSLWVQVLTLLAKSHGSNMMVVVVTSSSFGQSKWRLEDVGWFGCPMNKQTLPNYGVAN